MEHKLLFLRAGTELTEQVADAFARWVQRSAVLFVWATIPYRTEWRYGLVAHKTIAQESGHVCQNLYLIIDDSAAPNHSLESTWLS